MLLLLGLDFSMQGYMSCEVSDDMGTLLASEIPCTHLQSHLDLESLTLLCRLFFVAWLLAF